MKDTLNFPFELMQFPLHADIACCGNYSSETCDFAPELKFPDQDFATQAMTLEVLEQFIEQYTEAQIHSDIHYFWRGGDPLLMSIEFMEQAVRLERKYARGIRIFNHLHTPGIRINERWCNFFKQQNFEISIELDGAPHNNEYYRHLDTPRTEQSRCTLRTLESLELLQQYDIPHYVVVNVHDRNCTQPIETYEYLKRQGIRRMQFRPVVKWNKNKITGPSVTPLGYGNFIISIFDQWIREDAGTVRIINFEQTIQQLKAPVCEFARTCGHHAYFSASGEVYPCRRYTQAEHCLGTLHDDTFTGLLYGRKQLRFGTNKQSTLTTQCRSCQYLEYCNGGCIRDRHALSDTGQRGHPYLCSAYKQYFSHVLTPLKYLAEELRIGHGAKRMKEYYRQ